MLIPHFSYKILSFMFYQYLIFLTVFKVVSFPFIIGKDHKAVWRPHEVLGIGNRSQSGVLFVDESIFLLIGDCKYWIYHRQTHILRQTDRCKTKYIKNLPDFIRISSIMSKSRTIISIRLQQKKNLAGKSFEQ